MTEKQSNYSGIGINHSYIEGFQLAEDPETGKSVLPPASYAMHWCMMACDVNRIFSREDLKEFLYRLPILLQSQHLLNKWFGEERLFSYKIGDINYEFTTSDIFDHYGIEIIDGLKNFGSRERFFNNMEQRIKNAILVGYISNYSVIPLENEIHGYQSEDYDKSIPEITKKVQEDAGFFAEDMIKLASPTLFNHQERFEEKLQNIEERKVAIAKIPTFQFEKISAQIVEKCIPHMYDPKWVKETKEEDPELLYELVKSHLYLAWLYANDYIMWDELFEAVPVEGIDIDEADYENDYGCFDLQGYYEDYNLKEVEPFVKGLFH